MRPRGRIFTLSIAAVGLVTLVAAGFAARGLLLEKYWLWKLKTGSKEEHVAAAKALGGLKSVAAIYPVLEALATDFEGRRDNYVQLLDNFESIGEAAMPELILHVAIRQYERPQLKTVVPAVRLLNRIYKHPENNKDYIDLIPWLQEIQNDRRLNDSTREAASRGLAYINNH